jgi:hypothetical protein
LPENFHLRRYARPHSTALQRSFDFGEGSTNLNRTNRQKTGFLL